MHKYLISWFPLRNDATVESRNKALKFILRKWQKGAAVDADFGQGGPDPAPLKIIQESIPAGICDPKYLCMWVLLNLNMNNLNSW